MHLQKLSEEIPMLVQRSIVGKFSTYNLQICPLKRLKFALCRSLGVLLYTLVYGAMPFDGSNFKRLVKQITTGDYYEPKSPSPASGLVRAMLTVSNEKRANIGDICSHWWVNEGYPQPCLDEAEYLASLTPVRLDLLLSLAPSAREEIIPGQEAQVCSFKAYCSQDLLSKLIFPLFQVPATPSLPTEEVSIEELPSIPPPTVEPIAPPPPLTEPVVSPVVPPLAASVPAVIDVKPQEPVEVKKREKEKGKRKLSETPSMVDPDLVTKKPSGRKSTTPVPTTPPPIPMEINDNAVYERQISPHRSGRSTPKASRKRREGAKTPVSEANNDQNNQPLVPEMTPEIQRKPPAPKAKTKGEDEAEVAKQMKRRLSRKERNVKTPDPKFEGGDHTKHIPAERPMTPRQARAPSPEERPLERPMTPRQARAPSPEDRPLVVPLPPPRVQDIPLPPVRGESLERPHQKIMPPPPRNESLERPPKSPVTPKSPPLLVESFGHNDKPPMIPPHATEKALIQPSTEVKEPSKNEVSINEKLPILPPRPAPIQTQEPEVIDTMPAPPPPPRSLPPEKTQEEIECKKREIEAKKKQMAEALKVLKQLESTVTPDKIDVVSYDQPVHEVQPLEIALPSLAQAKEGVRNSGLFNSIIQVNVPPVTAVQPEVKKPEPIEVKTLPVANKEETTSSLATSLIRQEQAQDLNEGHQAKQPLKKEVIDNQINERADSSKQIERIAHEGQGQQKDKVGSLPVQDSEQEKRPKPSETMSQGKAADNQMNLFSAKQELASQKTTNDVMHPVSAEVDKSLTDVNGTASKTDENRGLINSLPKPFQANNIPNDEEPVSENSREISRAEKAQEPLHIETQPTPSIHQLSLDHTPESTLPSPQSVPVTPPNSDSPQNVPKYHLLQRPEKRDNRDSKVIKAAAYWNTYIGEVLDKKKPIPDNVKSLEKPKKIVTAGVGPKGYNDLKTAFESKTSTPKQEEPSINVSPSSTAVGGMQRRNSRKIPIEGCSPGLKVTDAKSVFETKHQQPQTPVVYRRNSSSTGDSIGKGKESDEFQTRGPNYVKKKVPEFPPPPIAKTPFGSNRRAGALSPQTIQPKDDKLSLQNGVPEDESKSKPKSVASTTDSLLKETSGNKPEVKTVDQNGKTSSSHNTTAAANERLQPKPSESQNGVKKDEQLSEQKTKSVKSLVSPKQESVTSTKPSPKPVSNDVIPSSSSTVPAFVDNKHSSKIHTVNEAPSIPVKPVIDIKSKHPAKIMPSTDTNGTAVKEVIKVKCDVTENDKLSGPKKVEPVKKQLPEKSTVISKDEGKSMPGKNESKVSAPEEREQSKPVPKSTEVKQLINEVKAAENVGNHRIIPIQIQQSSESRVPVQIESTSDLRIPIQTESTSEMKIPIHTVKSEDSHKADSRQEATKIPIQTEPISSRVPIQIESNETLSRQESVRSPVSQEHHIPIHVEGKGTILNKVSSTASGLDGDSLEGRDNFSTNSLSRRRFGSRKKRSSYAYSDSSNSSNLGAVEPSQEESYDASSGGLQKYTSIGKHGIEPMFRLRKTRPPFAAQRSDSFSSGEEEFEDEYFRETTAENLFSTLLTRVKSLTRRINDEDDQLRHQNHKIINHRLNPGGTHGFLERTALRSSLKRTPSSTQSALSRQSSMDTSGMRASFRDDPSYEVGGYDDGTSSVRSYGSSAMDRDVGGYGRSSIHRGTTIKDDQIDGSLYKGGGVSMKGKHEQQEQNKRFGLEQNAVKKADSEDLSSSVSVTSKQRLRPGYLPPPSHLASESNSDLANFDTRIENALSESSSVKSMPASGAQPLKRVPITVERGLSSASLASGPSQSDMLETMSEHRARNADNSKRHSRVMFHLHEANEPPKEQPSSQPVWIKKENVGDESPAATQVKSPYKFVQIKRLSAGLDLDDDRSLASTSSGYVSQQQRHLPAKVEGSRLRSYNNQEGQLQTNKPLTLEKESSKPSTISTASFTASNSSSVASNINVGPSNPMPEPMPISVASSVQDSMSKLPSSPPASLPTTQLSVPISKPKPTIKSPPKLYLPRVTQSPPKVSSPPAPVTQQASSSALLTSPPTQQPMTIPSFSQIQSVPQKSQLSSPTPKSTPPQYAPPSLPSDETIPESVIKPVASSQPDSAVAPKVKSPVLTQPLYTPFRRSSISEGDSNSATSPPGTASSISPFQKQVRKQPYRPYLQVALTQDRLHRNSNAHQKDPNSEGEMGVDNGKGSNSRRIILPYGGAKSDGLLNKHAFISCNVIAAAERRKRDSYSRSSTTELPLEKVIDHLVEI